MSLNGAKASKSKQKQAKASKSKQKQAKASKSKQKQANGTIGCTTHAGINRAKLPTPSSQGYST
jgi:hypothetical protein